MEVRAMPVTAMFLPQARKEISEIFEKVLETPSVAVLDLQGDGGFGRARIEAKMLLAPLKNDFGDVNRILGCLQSVGAIGRQPRRFRVTGVTIRELDVPRTASAKMPARVGPVQSWRLPGLQKLRPVFRMPRTPKSRAPESRALARQVFGSWSTTPDQMTAALAATRRRSPSSSATRNASSSAWLAFRRGSQAV
jgi:hypothetical protein